jgi:uncharacterized protein (DUF305 family)
MKTFTSIALAATLALTAGLASGSHLSAQEKGSGSGSGAETGKGSGSGSMGKMDKMGKMGKMQPKGDKSESSQAYNQANMTMHRDMNITFSGDADVDFARGMIPHHQGAIDMARVVLKYGSDPELKKLAEDIIKAQETEISTMKEWLKKKGK